MQKQAAGTVIEHESQENQTSGAGTGAGALSKQDQSQQAMAAETAFKDFNPSSAIVVLAKMVATGVPKETIQQMKELVEWDDSRRALAEFDAAFSLAKAEFKEAKKSGYNSGTQKNYSLLEDYDEATREALSKHGLSWRHIPANVENGQIRITCVLAHKGGHRETAWLEASPGDMENKMANDLQAVGIVSTYLKRITLASMLGLVSDSEFDNDGRKPGAAQNREPVSQPQRKSQNGNGHGNNGQGGNGSRPAAATSQNGGDNTPLKENQINLVKAKLKAANLGEADLFAAFGAKSFSDIPASKINAVLEWIKKHG